MKHIAAMVVLLFLLSACTVNSRLADFTSADVAAAQALASISSKSVVVPEGAIDPQGVQCWGALAPVASQLGSGQALGLAMAIELYRVAKAELVGPCADLAMPILIKLNTIPGFGQFVGALAIGG